MSDIIRDLVVTQETEWDCGLAVVRAVLWIKNGGNDAIHIDAPRRSLWTIELVLLLHRYEAGEGVVFATTCCGVNPNYKRSLKFYQEADDCQDPSPKEEDVEQFFEIARNIGVRIRRTRVSDHELEDVLMNTSHMAIVLVDGTVLMGGESGHFLGHYVLIYDFKPETGIFYAKNPNSLTLNDEIHKSILHRARAQFGTDNDIIFVPM